MRNILLKIQYDGTNFNGSQIQKSGRTVQGVLQKAIFDALGENPILYFSGRTDSGVHAKEQFVNFNIINDRIPAEKIYHPIKRYLPEDVLILNSYQVKESFNSRFDALRRTYRYYFIQKEDLFKQKYALIYPYNFDIKKANLYTKYFIGKKNFKSFCSSKCEVKNHFCEIEKMEFIRIDSNNFYMEITANRYLQNMIRIIISTFLLINQGKINNKQLDEIFKAENRIAAPKTISPKGLFLWKIEYRDDILISGCL